MLESFEVSVILPVSAERLFKAWLDSDEHAAFTGASASIDPNVGGAHSAWDGYIQGETLELNPPRRIVQSWRTTEFPPESKDSRLEILLEEIEAGTKLTIIHSGISEGQSENYRIGWTDHYFTPMKAYFSGGGSG